MNNYNGVICIVDLAEGSCSTEDFDETLMEKGLGGAGINMELFEKYKDRDPLILGSGFFTATFMPGACCGVMTAKSPVTGSVAHVPFGWQTGVELKLTGFDFVVILGRSEKPVRLWLHDGLSDIDDASDVWGSDVWQSVDKIREVYGDEMAQMFVIGKAGESKAPGAAVSENYWGSKDKAGLGAVFGEKNLKAVAMRGLGALEVAEGFFDACMALKESIKNGAIKGKAGLADIGTALGVDSAAIDKLKSLTHRHNAAYNCPYPSYTFLKYREAPSAMAMQGDAEPGCLVSDIGAFAAFNALGVDAAQAMEKCYRLGVEPVAAAAALKQQGSADISALEAIAASATACDAADGYPEKKDSIDTIAGISRAFSFAVPPVFIFGPDSGGPEAWVKKQAIAYILGIDPVLAIMCPEITEDTLAELVGISAEWEDFSVETLSNMAQTLIDRSKG